VGLTLDIVTPHGVVWVGDRLDRVVIRRREAEYCPGSEIAIYPHHAPLLMQTEACRLRITSAGQSTEREVEAGVLEVFNDRVTLVVT
jgi:F0F1-type ATP synthase epsilon subunit